MSSDGDHITVGNVRSECIEQSFRHLAKEISRRD